MSENIDFVQKIVTWIEEKQIFSYEKKSNKQRALGMLLYNAGLSYKKAGFKRHTVISFIPRSAIERLFGDLEQKIRRF